MQAGGARGGSAVTDAIPQARILTQPELVNHFPAVQAGGASGGTPAAEAAAQSGPSNTISSFSRCSGWWR